MIDFNLIVNGEHSDLIPEVYETATLQDNLEHSGGITVSWKAKTDGEIPIGSYITYNGTRYILLEQYAPTRQDAVHYRYDPTFRHPMGLIDRTPFWIRSKDSSGVTIDLRTTSFTGYPGTIAKKLCDFFSEYVQETGDTFFRDSIGTDWTFDMPFAVDKSGRLITTHTIITVAFDSCSIKSAASAIADAMGCNVFFDWTPNTEGKRTIRFIAGTTIQGETYNCFHVLGGTTNMGKRTVRDSFSTATQRMTLKESKYPGSLMRTDNTNGIRLTKDLIFDDIYPKMELYIRNVHERVCYLTDEKGDYIVESGNTYKKYSKWYIELSYDRAGTNRYNFDQRYLIDDQPLSLLFQVDYEHPESMSSLVGNKFELTYFPGSTMEWDKTDVVPQSQAYTVPAGWFRIAFTAVNDTILPSSSTKGLYPKKGDKVTLVNMALGDGEKSRAQDELESAAKEIISLMQTPSGEYTETMFLSNGERTPLNLATLPHDYTFKKGDTIVIGTKVYECTQNTSLPPFDFVFDVSNKIVVDQSNGTDYVVIDNDTINAGWRSYEATLSAVQIGAPSPFGEAHGPVVTAINHNLDTNVAEVTVGSWARKTRTGGMADKIETVTVSANASTTGGDAFSNGSFTGGAGSNSNTQTVFATTQVKPDTLFTAYLNKIMDTVECYYDGKPKADTDIFFKTTAFYGTTNVGNVCHFKMTFGNNISVYYGLLDASDTPTTANVNRVVQSGNTMYDMNENTWMRVHLSKDMEMADTIDIAIKVQHPRHGDRDLSFTINSTRPGKAADEPMQAFKRNNSTTEAPELPSKGKYDKDWTQYAPNYSSDKPHLWMTQTTVHILPNGSKEYDEWSTAIRLSGDPGADAPDKEWIYIKSNTYPFNGTQPKDVAGGRISGQGDWIPKANQYKVDDYVPDGWSDRALPADNDVKYVYAAYRDKDSGVGNNWKDFTSAFLWSNWGVQGLDGDGVQYIYKLYPIKLTDAQLTSFIPTGPTTKNDAGEWLPVTKASADTYANKSWVDDAENLTRDYPFCYCSVVKEIGGKWQKDSQGHVIYNKLALWSTYAENAMRLDLDNQADIISVDSDKKVRFERTVTTVVRLFNGGSKAAIGKPSASSVSAKDTQGTPVTISPNFSPQSGTATDWTISWTFPHGYTVEDTYSINISYTYEGVEYKGVFTIGTTKASAIVQVLPTPSEVSFTLNQSTNKLGPDSIALKCGYTKITGSGTVSVDNSAHKIIVETGTYYYLFYRSKTIVNNQEVWSKWKAYNSGTTLDTIPVNNNTSVTDYEFCINSSSSAPDNDESTIIDREVVPVVKDGKNGSNVIRFDISNEMDAVPTDSTGKITADRTVETIVRLYDGATEIDLKGKTFTISGGPASSIATLTYSDYGNGRKLSWKFLNGQTMASTYSIVIKYTYGGTDYTATFSVIASKGEAIWQLKPSTSSIPFHRDANNNLTPASQNVGLILVKIDGGSVTEYSRVQTGIKVYYDYENMPGYESGAEWSNGNIPVTNARNNLFIAMFKSSGELLDRESIPVVKDGENGPEGPEGPQGPQGPQGKYEEKQYAISAYSSSTDSSTMPSDCQESSWVASPPIPTKQKPYLWQRTRTYNPANSTYTSWIYTRTTGEAGGNGHVGRWYYYDGVWESSKTYRMEETQAPYVKYKDNFYMLDNKGGSSTSVQSMPPDYTGEGNPWSPMSSEHQYYIAMAFFGDYAHLGSFIINADWMISQYGTLYNANGVTTPVSESNYLSDFTSLDYTGSAHTGVPYTFFAPKSPNANLSGCLNFVPAFAIDGKTGRVYMNQAYVKGEVQATSGTFTGTVHANNGYFKGGLTVPLIDLNLTTIGNYTDKDYSNLHITNFPDTCGGFNFNVDQLNLTIFVNPPSPSSSMAGREFEIINSSYKSKIAIQAGNILNMAGKTLTEYGYIKMKVIKDPYMSGQWGWFVTAFKAGGNVG